MLSIVIPTLNAERELPATLDSVANTGFPSEIVVADGGSTDTTPALAAGAKTAFIAVPGGRGAQLAAGVGASVGDWLLFLHADTRPQPGWNHVAEAFMTDARNRFRAGYFRFILNDGAAAARRVERLVHWRCQVLALPYGDQGLLISREFYDVLGGFAEIPLMEDVDMTRRIGRKRLFPLAATAVTSAERYRRGGYWLRPAKNFLCLGLYLVGLPPQMISGIYE